MLTSVQFFSRYFDQKPQCYAACVNAMEQGRMHVDCVNVDGNTLLTVLCAEGMYGLDFQDLIWRLCALRPNVEKFWNGVCRRFACEEQKSVTVLPEYVWSNLEIVFKALDVCTWNYHCTKKHVAAELRRRFLKRWTPLRTLWLYGCYA
jgi:hypothetical protein